MEVGQTTSMISADIWTYNPLPKRYMVKYQICINFWIPTKHFTNIILLFHFELVTGMV